MLCHQEAPKVKKFVEESAEVPKDFIAAAGNVEITIDATKVNTSTGVSGLVFPLHFERFSRERPLKRLCHSFVEIINKVEYPLTHFL